MSYTAEELYFGPLQLQARSPAFLAKWQRMLRLKQKTLAHFARARQAVPEEKVRTSPGRPGGSASCWLERGPGFA